MKKAKITLTAIVMFAVAGGTFAFNAVRINSRIYYAITANQPATLTINAATLAPGLGVYMGTAYATTTYSAIVTRSVPYYRGL